LQPNCIQTTGYEKRTRRIELALLFCGALLLLASFSAGAQAPAELPAPPQPQAAPQLLAQAQTQTAPPPPSAPGQPTPLSWQEIRDRFEKNNPTLQADQSNVDESKAEEITAYLRPNPQLSLSSDGTQLAPYHGTWVPFAGTQSVTNFSYLHERDHKRELRLLTQQQQTAIQTAGHTDLDRNMVFALRSAFIGILQAKATVDMATQDLAYWDRVLDISRTRLQAGDIAQIDYDQLELQRVQYESEIESAEINLRTSKIAVLTFLNDRTPVDQFDVIGLFDFTDQLQPLDSFRQTALDNRPDLKEAMESVDQSKTNYKLAVSNGSTDPTFSAWWSYNPSFNNPLDKNTLGVGVSIPLRVFDRNQGEKLRTKIDIDRNQQLLTATQAQVYSDVDSAYAEVDGNITLLRPYKAKYLDQAKRVRDTIEFSYQHGGASLLDFLNAQAAYRQVQIAYINLVGTYLTAAAQLNMAVGKDVIQ
jgi:outer membrane protein, heavy metal efflux system